MSWEIIRTAPKVIQVIPLMDVHEHYEGMVWSNLGFGLCPISKCRCLGRTDKEADGRFIIVHNSFDGREGIEWCNKILGNG